MTVVYLGLGANLADPAAQLRAARAAVAALPGVAELACSRLYRSAPMGPQDQPEYVNAVMAVETELAPDELLRALQAIETAQGRVRIGQRWGARTLDLDILLWGDLQILTADLTVPHPGLPEREFVLYPLAEIAPENLAIPGHGKLAELVAACPQRGLSLLETETGALCG